MLDPASWLPAAQSLAEGQRKLVPHDCGDGNKMVVDHRENGWSAWCYRCSDKGFVPHPRPSLAERIERITRAKVVDSAASTDPRPPMPANFNPSTWPLEARVWLYKAGLSNETIAAHGFYYCDPLSRVVMPIFHEGRVVYWQARGFDRSRPKYVNPPVDRTSLSPRFGAGTTLVLTEDLLSAIRVGEVTAARSLMGTNMSDSVLRLVKADGLPTCVWLDPDSAGSKGRRKIAAQLRAYGVSVRTIITERDPKFYSKEEITEFLST